MLLLFILLTFALHPISFWLYSLHCHPFLLLIFTIHPIIFIFSTFILFPFHCCHWSHFARISLLFSLPPFEVHSLFRMPDLKGENKKVRRANMTKVNGKNAVECRTPQHRKLTQNNGSCMKVNSHRSKVPLHCTSTPFWEHISTKTQSGPYSYIILASTKKQSFIQTDRQHNGYMDSTTDRWMSQAMTIPFQSGYGWVVKMKLRWAEGENYRVKGTNEKDKGWKWETWSAGDNRVKSERDKGERQWPFQSFIVFYYLQQCMGISMWGEGGRNWVKWLLTDGNRPTESQIEAPLIPPDRPRSPNGDTAIVWVAGTPILGMRILSLPEFS